MEKMICTSCGAPLIPNTTQAFLTCAYCDATVPNPHYNEADAKAAAEPDLDALCVTTLLEMGESEKLDELGDRCFGNPLSSIQSARAAMDIPDREKVYLLMEHLTILGSVKEAFALAESGLYYKCDNDEGRRSWETFITGAVACVDRDGWQQDGTLTVGTSLAFSLSSDADARIARFLIDFHNRVYQQHTGQTAPEAWTVTTSAAQAQSDDSPSLAGTLATAAGMLLGGSMLRRTTLHQPAFQRTSKIPAAPRSRIGRPVPARPSRSAAPQHNKPLQRMERPGSAPRPMHGPDSRGGMGDPGHMRGPGGRGGMGGPGGRGGRGGMGGPGRR